jgi:hypothetical protein
MSAGRLDVDEYGERSAKVAAAKTRGELTAVFTDLPDPRPVFGGRQPVRQAPAYGQPVPSSSRPQPGEPWGWTTELAQSWEQRPLAQRLTAGLVPVAAIVALVLFLTVLPIWWIFLLPAAVAMFGGAVWGDDWKDARRQQHDQRHIARERRHDMRHDYRRDRRRDR